MRFIHIFFRVTLILLCPLFVGCATRLATVSSSTEVKKSGSDSTSISQKTVSREEQAGKLVDYMEIEFFPPSKDSVHASTEPKVKKITAARILTQSSSEEKVDTNHVRFISTAAEESAVFSRTENPISVTSKWKYIFYSLVLLSMIAAFIYLRRIWRGRLNIK